MARRWSQSGMRAVGALTGLGVIAARRVAGAEGPPVAAGGPLAVAAVVGVLEGLPPLRRAMFAGLGRDRAELLVGAVNVVALSLVGACAAACAMEWVLWGKPDQVRRTAPAPDTSIHGYAVTNTSARLARALDELG
jgi:hypothetical protein